MEKNSGDYAIHGELLEPPEEETEELTIFSGDLQVPVL